MRLVGHSLPGVSLLGIAVGGFMAFAGPSRKRHPLLGVAIMGGAVAAALARWQFSRFFTDSPSYDVLATEGDFELRQYGATVRAETVVYGASWEDALNDGFHRLAGYIFGDNASTSKLSMTAPVLGTLGPANRPNVTESSNAASETTVRPRRNHVISFVLLANARLAELPAPRDRRVRLQEVRPRRVAVVKFRGPYEGGPASAHARGVARPCHGGGP